ncbi:DUF3558 domain-containing protein [Nocardia aurantia]|uniref:DUF3558 domain-containing protein n=1 Tax=Nocardia aurantia TaxID=2585199 RepID=A0A7K0DV48_9NOCA|nr:DUF3558 domain-containing protein [Nocardia aurantia]MQY29643.1 hypothetical protein [Nocardia aurantia]
MPPLAASPGPRVLLAIVAAATAGACSSGGGDGGASTTSAIAGTAGATDTKTGAAPSTTFSGGRLFDPCSDLGDKTLRKAGLDPKTKGVDDTQSDVWLVCHWKPTDSDKYVVSVLSTTRTLAQGRENATVTDYKDVKIGPRSGFTAVAIDPDHLRCYAAMPAAQGMFEVLVVWRADVKAGAGDLPPCKTAVKYATALEPDLPK